MNARFDRHNIKLHKWNWEQYPSGSGYGTSTFDSERATGYARSRIKTSKTSVIRSWFTIEMLNAFIRKIEQSPWHNDECGKEV